MTQATHTAANGWLSSEELRRFHTRWEEIQSGFVSDPRGSLDRADGLVADLVDRIAARFGEERRALQGRWQPTETPTESLRTSLQSYRDMFETLLA